MNDAIIKIIVIHFICFTVLMIYMGFVTYKENKKKDQ